MGDEELETLLPVRRDVDSGCDGGRGCFAAETFAAADACWGGVRAGIADFTADKISRIFNRRVSEGGELAFGIVIPGTAATVVVEPGRVITVVAGEVPVGMAG